MAEDPLDDIITSVRARLQSELDRQLLAAAERHERALAAAREQIEAEAERRWTREREAMEAERDQQVQAAVTAARSEMERQAADEAARLRAEMEQALASERQLSESRVDAERSAASSGHGSLIRGIRDIDAATSLSDALGAIARAAAAEAPRAALFIANGRHLDEWAVSGLPSLSAGALTIDDPDGGIAVEALVRQQTVRNNGTACAVPLVLDGAPIAVVYGESEAGDGDATWNETLEAVARHGAARLGYLTALRTAQARQWLAAGAEPRQSDGADDAAAAAASARRYARLVVSEVKLYNEAAVQSGRSRRDLRERLASEIERARRLYEDRVPASVPGRADFFQQELVQTLAGGDPSLLG